MPKIPNLIPLMRRRKRVRPAPGAAPGTLAMSSEQSDSTLVLTSYDQASMTEEEISIDDIEARVGSLPTGKTVWLDVQGLGHEDTLRQLAKLLKLHPLTLEDIVHVHQRPKVEIFDEYLFVTMRCVRLLEDGGIDNEQISLVVKDGLLVTFQERKGDGFDPVRKRIREGKGTIRQRGADYIAYALIDVSIDLVYPVLEAYGDAMDRLDEDVSTNPQSVLQATVHSLKRELRMLRRAVWPLRELTMSLSRDDIAFVDETVRVAFRDCYDHAMMAADFLESSRERIADIGDRYLAIVAERTNQTMKVLTIIATIFIPLTYLAGIYGMNFDTTASNLNMPELGWRYGYITFWGVSFAVAFTMLGMFWKKGWLSH